MDKSYEAINKFLNNPQNTDDFSIRLFVESMEDEFIAKYGVKLL